MKNNLQKLILELIAETDRLSRQELTPLTVQQLRELQPVKTDDRKVKPKYVVNRTIKRLEERGMIRYVVTETRRLVHLTPEGEERLTQLRGYDHLVSIPKRWDGMYRIVILNFSEHDRSVRDAIRRILKDVGFRPLKSSLWVHTADCRQLVSVLRKDFNIQDELIYIEANHIEPLSALEE